MSMIAVPSLPPELTEIVISYQYSQHQINCYKHIPSRIVELIAPFLGRLDAWPAPQRINTAEVGIIFPAKRYGAFESIQMHIRCRSLNPRHTVSWDYMFIDRKVVEHQYLGRDGGRERHALISVDLDETVEKIRKQISYFNRR